ncbi:MAG: hypothetical protein K9N47_27705 [Prosthecobacter sp.]|uniref:hypothetical protein n=1 Tax=Prosthecobacter sp. TaxID=1965333 RepID=UPI002605ED08|nr:hypothetical protein [Prosthecobacter sp.]MCF7789940.1 hypothetical protein [Prosthecobacter sp.]
MPTLERREFLGTALTLVPGFHILNAMAVNAAVPHALQSLEEMNFVDLQRLRAMENTENWIAMHAEHCINRIIWNGLISEWTEQLRQKIDYFADLANGKDGGPGIMLTNAQMELISWQTLAYSGAAPCETRLFVSTLFLIDMTVSYYDASDQRISTTYAAAVKSKYPALHESLIGSLRVLNTDDLFKYMNNIVVMGDVQVDASKLLCDNLKAVAPAVKDHILFLLQESTSTNEANV